MDIPSPTHPPGYPLGEGNNFHPEVLYTGASRIPTRRISQRPTPPKSPVLLPSPPGPSPFGERGLKTTTILQRQARSKTAFATRPPTPRLPTPPAPSYRDRDVPPGSVTSISTSTSTHLHPPHLPTSAPKCPNVTQPQPGHKDPHPYSGQAPQTQRQPHPASPRPPQHDPSQRAGEPEPEPAPAAPSPGPSFTSTPPASVRGPSPSPLPTTSPRFAHESLLSMQARRFVARVEAREQADREDEERGRKERRWKGVRGRVRWLFRGG